MDDNPIVLRRTIQLLSKQVADQSEKFAEEKASFEVQIMVLMRRIQLLEDELRGRSEDQSGLGDSQVVEVAAVPVTDSPAEGTQD